MSCVTNPLKDRPSAYAEAVDAYGAKKAYTGEKRVAVIAYDPTTPRGELRRTGNIGNRTSVTSVSSVVNYSPNNLNQYTQRQISEMINLRGSAETGATVTVKMGSSQSESVTRQEKYWHKQLTSTNDSEAQYPLIKVVGVAKNAATNGDDIVTIETGHVFVAKTPEQFTYDEDGNLLSDGRWEYTCPSVDGSTLRCENGDPTLPRLRRTGNRLVSMETATNKVGTTVPVVRLLFSYDYQGRRASKTVYEWDTDHWSLTTDHCFVYDSWNLISETTVNRELGTTNVSSYTWGLDLSGSLQGAGGIGGLVATVRSGDPEPVEGYYTFDANGNVSELLTDTGEIAAHYQYDPYGNTLVSEGDLASDNVYRFSTKYTDTETKLLYYGFRYYSPELGRWLSRDPILEKGGQNLMAFCYNRIGSFVDRDGREPVPVVYDAPCGGGCEFMSGSADMTSFQNPDTAGASGCDVNVVANASTSPIRTIGCKCVYVAHQHLPDKPCDCEHRGDTATTTFNGFCTASSAPEAERRACQQNTCRIRIWWDCRLIDEGVYDWDYGDGYGDEVTIVRDCPDVDLHF